MKLNGVFSNTGQFIQEIKKYENQIAKHLQESRCIISFAEQAIKIGWLKFPFEIKSAESPDFILMLDGSSIGVEITKAMNSAYTELINQEDSEKEPIDGVLRSFITCDDIIDPGLSRKAIKEAKQGFRARNSGEKAFFSSPIQMGNGPEKIWIPYIKNAINKKAERRDSIYKKLDAHWLLIDDFTPIWGRRLDLTRPLLNDYLLTPNALGGFEKIGVLTSLTDINEGEKKTWLMLDSASTGFQVSPL